MATLYDIDENGKDKGTELGKVHCVVDEEDGCFIVFQDGPRLRVSKADIDKILNAFSEEKKE